MKKIILNNMEYDLIKDYKSAFELTELEDKFTVGDGIEVKIKGFDLIWLMGG